MTKDTTVDITSEKMPELLKTKLESLTPFARRYAEYRAKGLKQPDSAEKAGSQAEGRASLGRVGWNTEQLDGVKEYILWLEHKRARAAVIDDLEIVDKLREVVDMAMEAGKFADANKALEHLGNMIGAFAYKNAPKEEQEKGTRGKERPTNNVDAFTQDLHEAELDARVSKLHRMMKDAKKSK